MKRLELLFLIAFAFIIVLSSSILSCLLWLVFARKTKKRFDKFIDGILF